MSTDDPSTKSDPFMGRPAAVTNKTAPAIQRLVDLGATLVGKQRLVQFASCTNPWDWTDDQSPSNPRGDGYLTCAASSSGRASSIAAQGMITLEGMLSQNWAQDTTGLFARDPVEWAKIAKHWDAPELHQSEFITGLPPLSVPDTMGFSS
ncbi:hypothetical protein ETB97_007821 [Aspergillus alliaceus]|uniref:Uncharacterized protein n=1 Tax=Petromyces alliaceus TaxID=209559 RepID=A0A8H6E1R8_PETAA|nr:hypothetical protein ETB97_007821 [Aspergillus burnettii]